MAPSARNRFEQQRPSFRAAACPSVGTTPRSASQTSTRAGSLRPGFTGTSNLESLKSEPLSATPKSSVLEGRPAVTLESKFNSSTDTGKSTQSEQILGHLENSGGVCGESEWTTVVGKSVKKDHARALRGLQNEVGRLKAELAAARAQRRSEADALRGKLTEAKREIANKESMIKEFRMWVAELRRQCADEKQYAEEKDSRIADLEKELARAREAGARREDARDRFEYVLACNGQAGSVPRSVLASAPESILYKNFCGEWDYARDKGGRALITCHPERWAAILEHLATGAVPAERDPLLLEQARYWNLSRLVEGLEARFPGVIVLENDESHFKVLCTFEDVTERLDDEDDCTGFSFAAVGGRWWAVNLHQGGFRVSAVKCPGRFGFPTD